MTAHPTGVRPIARVKAQDLVAFLKVASFLIEPDEVTQRKAFSTLMPCIYTLRETGWSWHQISDLVSHAGLDLKPSTMRSYYSEMLAKRQDICQAWMTDQILLMAEVKKCNDEAKDLDLRERLHVLLKRRRS